MSEQSLSEVYAPDCCMSGDEEESSKGYRRRIEKVCQNSIEGKWTEYQNLQYALFMDYHSKIFLSKEKRKSTRIFKTLSKFLATRTPRQCRSHFQKIMGKFKTVKKIKQYYQDLLGVIDYQQKYEAVAKKLEPEIIKIQDREEKKAVESTSTCVQTDTMTVSIADLPESQLAKLLNIVGNYHKRQFSMWASNPYGLPFGVQSWNSLNK